MWRFILVSFGFLGLAFYEASGGADYAPAPDSLQVAMADKPLFAPALDMSQFRAIASANRDEQPSTRVAEVADRPNDRPAGSRTGRPAEMRAGERQEQVVYAGLSGLSEDELGGVSITLASAAQPADGVNAEARTLDGIGSFTAETLVSDVQDTPIDQAIVSTQGTTESTADIRSVAGDLVNMRSGPGTDYAKIDQLARGTDVEVLGRQGAWVELRDLDTGQTGWMADWLVTAAN